MTPTLAICLPNFSTVSMPFVNSLAAQMHSLGLDGFDRAVLIHGSASTGAYRARNQIMKTLDQIEEQVGYKYEWTMWYDTDMIFPSRTVQALISHDKDIVGATYKRRAAPYEMMGKPVEGSNGSVTVGQLAEAGALPTGCLLIRRSVFNSIKRPYWKVFNAPDMKDDKSEDTLFCEEARACGYKVWLDTTLTSHVGHLAEIPLMADVEQVHPSVIMPKSNGRIIHA